MKYIKLVSLILLTLVMIFIGNRAEVNAYACPENTYCNTNGGVIYVASFARNYDPVTGAFLNTCQYLDYQERSYDCTGTAASCTGGYEYYTSYKNCVDGVSSYSGFCCDPIPCVSTCESSCSPGACPTGYTKDPNQTGTVCQTSYKTSVSCDRNGSNCPPTAGCGGDSDTCYLLETNTEFIQSNGSTSGPASISIIVDGRTYNLSTDPNNPTQIKLPANGSSNVQVSVPTFTAPTTSRGGGYQFIANNYGTNDQWEPWTTCSGIAGEDFCTTVPNTNNTQAFVPTSKTVNQVLKENAEGKISGIYYTVDKCTDTYKYSTPIEGYYVVDEIPPCIDGEPDCPPPPPPIFSNIGATATVKGCTSATFSGREANNELHVVADVTDTDSPDEIRAFTIWFSPDTNFPAVGTIAASYTGSINTDVGIMIKKNGTSWNNPNVYATNSNQTWGLVTMNNEVGYITVAGTNIIEISQVSVTQDTDVTFDYRIRFLESANNLSGMYNVYGGGLDSYMVNGATLDQSYFEKFLDWGVDLVNPTTEEITQQIRDPQNTFITWSVDDAISGTEKTVINAYRVGGTVFDQAKLYLPAAYTANKGNVILNEIPLTSDIGMYNDPSAWIFDHNTGEIDLLNIGLNERGEIAMYVTTYDEACNTNGTSADIDLDPWFATRGATVYSNGNISTTAKPVAGLPYLDGVFNPKTGMNSNLIDLGTELLSSRNTFISTLIHSNSGATMATDIEDSNNVTGVWYNKLLKKLDTYKAELTAFTKQAGDLTVSSRCTTGTECYMYSTESITIPQGYRCDRKTLFVSEQDIHINPTVQSDTSSLTGCIFLARNNIYVDGGAYKSTSGIEVQYDYIEGYLIADNQIIFSVADENRVLRDAVEIFGGMVAFGTNPTGGESAIAIKRNLRLYSQINPTVVLTYDNKYSSISTAFFGTEYNLYKQEVGFKTF